MSRKPLDPGETGLPERCALAAESISVVRKENLLASRASLRQLSEAQLYDLARRVMFAMGFVG